MSSVKGMRFLNWCQREIRWIETAGFVSSNPVHYSMISCIRIDLNASHVNSITEEIIIWSVPIRIHVGCRYTSEQQVCSHRILTNSRWNAAWLNAWMAVSFNERKTKFIQLHPALSSICTVCTCVIASRWTRCSSNFVHEKRWNERKWFTKDELQCCVHLQRTARAHTHIRRIILAHNNWLPLLCTEHKG